MTHFKEENKLIHDALSGATPPDLESSWGKMEELLDTAAAEEAATTVVGSGAKYRIWLNSVVLLITAVSLIGLMANWKPKENSATTVLQDSQNSNPMVATSSIEQALIPAGELQEGVLKPSSQMFASTSDIIENSSATGKSSTTTENKHDSFSSPSKLSGGHTFSSDTLMAQAGAPLKWTYKNLEIDELEEPITQFDAEGDSAFTLTEDFIEQGRAGIRTYVKAGLNTGYGFDFAHVFQYMQFGFGVDLGHNYVHTLRAELLYNPILTRPISAKSSQRLPAGYNRTDSFSVRKINYISFPVMINYNFNRGWSGYLGAQFSLATGSSGDQHTTTDLTGEYTQEKKFAPLGNAPGISRTNASVVLGAAYTRGRSSFEVRSQIGVIDQSENSNTNLNYHNLTFGYSYRISNPK